VGREWHAVPDNTACCCYDARVSETAKKLYDEALKLDDEERSVLALRLLDSVGEAPEAVEKAWLDEVRARLKDIDEGRVAPVTWEDAKQRIFAQGR
jgi:putative addiction module component (TIGR02574 family)